MIGLNQGIELCSLTKMYKQKPVFKRLDLVIPKGEIVSLVGPSGTGKTTLLRCIAGLETLDEGEIKINGENVTWSKPQKRPVVMMFQQPLLFSHMTVFENVEYGLKAAKKKNRREQVAAMLEKVDMSAYSDAYPNELSGGQQQRISLARALIVKPQLILLDEPFSSLDPELRKKMRMWVRKLLKEEGMSALFVTHDMEEAMYMGDRAAVLADGRVHQADVPETLYLHPKTEAAASIFSEGMMTGSGSFVHVSNLRLAVDKNEQYPYRYAAEIEHIFMRHGATFYTLKLKDANDRITIHSDLSAGIQDSVYVEVIHPELIQSFDHSEKEEDAG